MIIMKVDLTKLAIKPAHQRTIRIGTQALTKPYCLILSILTLALAPPCLSFEARFYPLLPNRDSLQTKKVFSTLAKASMIIKCNGADEIDVSTGNDCKESGSYDPIYLTKSQVYMLLKEQRDKRLLAVWFLKPIMALTAVKIQEILNDYRAFIADLDYEGVLIQGAASSGVYVVYDSEQPPLSPGEAKGNIDK